MAKRKSSVDGSTSGLEKLSVPGVNMTEVLELQEAFPGIRHSICVTMIAVVCIAQIRYDQLMCPASQIQSLESVNTYIRTILAKSPPVNHLAAAVAIRRTIAEHALDVDDSRIVSNFNDLTSDLSGPVSTKGSYASCMGNPAKLRALRRGFMAQVIGQLQAVPVHYPTRIAKDVGNVTSEDYLSRMPFDTSDITMDTLVEEFNRLLSPDGSILSFTDIPFPTVDKLPMESQLLIQRTSPDLPSSDIKVPASAPSWKKAAAKQMNNLRGGGKS